MIHKQNVMRVLRVFTALLLTIAMLCGTGMRQANAEKARSLWGLAEISAGTLNVRSEGNTDAKPLYTAARGETVLLVGKSGNWYQIETVHGKGWVLASYVKASEITHSLKQGDKGDAVTVLQKRLIALDCLSGEADGDYGKMTKTAVARFQERKGLKQTGEADEATLTALFTESAQTTEPTDTSPDKLTAGDKGDAVTALQERLIELGYMTAAATGYFGSATKQALIGFQKDAGLTADGIAGADTLAALRKPSVEKQDEIPLAGTFRLGSRGNDVKVLQNRLRELGYLTANATGTFGEATRSAVKAFQAASGLKADGIVGAETLAALRKKDAPAKQDTAAMKPGSRGKAVTQLQERLKTLGWFSGSVDGEYGSATQAAVREFQSASKLTVDGIAGSATIMALYANSAVRREDGTLRRGDHGDKVAAMQTSLRRLGYLQSSADGVYGEKTESAVSEFQKAMNLKQDGIASASLIKAMDASDAKYKEGTYLAQGASGKTVTQLQKRLIELKYTDSAADGRYGAITVQAITAFQKEAGLPQTGIADAVTQEKLMAAGAPVATVTAEASITGTPLATLSVGSRGTAVSELQQALILRGYLSGKADGIYGEGTASAVKAFQKAAGLTATGKADSKTRQLLAGDVIDLTQTLREGSSGDGVKQLQQRLRALGWFAGSADGVYGEGTKNAVEAFQTASGLKGDGIAGSATLKLLFSKNAMSAAQDVQVESGSSEAAKIIAYAKEYRGCPYVFAANGPKSFDCSGFTKYVFGNFNYKLTRSAQSQGYAEGKTHLTRSQLKPGDLVFFDTITDDDACDHVGIYIEDGYFIHCSSRLKGVVISSLDSGYYHNVFSWGIRIIK